MEYTMIYLIVTIVCLNFFLLAWSIWKFKRSRITLDQYCCWPLALTRTIYEENPRVSGIDNRHESVSYDIYEIGLTGSRGTTISRVDEVPVNNGRASSGARSSPYPLTQNTIHPPPAFIHAVEMPVPVYSTPGQTKLEELPPSYQEYLGTVQNFRNVPPGEISKERY